MACKTFVKWSGNKSMHLRHIVDYVPEEYNTYIEPFVGSGALFLKLQPEQWIINDLNKDLINIWKLVRNNPDYLIQEFKKFGKKFKPMTQKNKFKFCSEITESIPEMSYDEDRAISFLLMSYCAFMGNLIINNKFFFPGLEMNIFVNDNYPFLKSTYFDKIENANQFLNKKKSNKIFNLDYKKVLEKSKKNDFVFLDPPYIEEKKYGFKYNKNEELCVDFLKELGKELKKLDKKGVMWLMTQPDTKEVKEIFKNYTIKKYKVYRKIQNQQVNELIIMNY